MKESGHINFLAHEEIKKHLKIGVSLNELNDIVDAFIRKNGAIPSELNYEGFPKSVCLSLNDEVVHGIPNNRKLKNGDILKLTTTEYNLMALFFKNEGKVLTHQQILHEIWGVGFQAETQYLRVYMAQLRKKIEESYKKESEIKSRNKKLEEQQIKYLMIIIKLLKNKKY
jgi:DNA-binding response OmpR family regulator